MWNVFLYSLMPDDQVLSYFYLGLSLISVLLFAVCICMKSQQRARLGCTYCSNVAFARSVLNKLANKYTLTAISEDSSFCHKWTLNFPNSLNLVWWHFFKQANGSRIILMYVKLRNKAHRPQSPKAGALVFLHCTDFCEISAVLPLRPYKWHRLILLLQEEKKMFLLYIWLLCRLFDILDMPFSLQYIKRWYLSSAGIYPLCFKD